MVVTIGSTGGLRVAIADDSALQYSDDYRDGWKIGFERAGCEVKVFDVSILRKMYSGPMPYRSIGMPGTPKALADRILEFHPDLVWCHHGRAASNQDFLSRLSKGRAKTAVYLCDEPYESGETARYSPNFRYVFTMDPCTVEAHRLSRQDRTNVFYLPPAVDLERFRRGEWENRSVPALFLGNASLPPRPSYLKPVEKMVNGADIRFWSAVGKRDKRWVPLDRHGELYRSTLIGLNVHRDPSITLECFKKRIVGRPSSMRIPSGLKLCDKVPKKAGTGFWNEGNLPAAHVNPRFMEMASTGALVVSDDTRSELERMFPMAPRAQDPQHFVELVLHYLENKDEARKIGDACSYLISRRHGYVHRAAEVLIRVGLMGSEKEDRLSFLGAPAGWLTPQDLKLLGIRSSSEATGHSERWSPQYGMSLIATSGNPREAISLDVPTPWLS